MILTERLGNLRNKAGISQEQLAEELNVSRQAVAKWESGATMPDINNLIALSRVLQVSLDYLLKEETYLKKKSERNHDSEMISFLVEAKRNTYASINHNNEAWVESSRLASKDLAYEAGDFKYLDTYVGGAHFSGTEVVYEKYEPIWSMNYNGRSLSGELGNFLLDALARVSAEMPYRGPAFFRDRKYTYVNLVSGEFDWFQGVEKIYYEDELIYELYYHGGKIN